MSFKVVILFLSIVNLGESQHPEIAPRHPEIAFIDADAISSLQEILASEFESMHKKIDKIIEDQRIASSTTTTPTLTTTTSNEMIKNDDEDEDIGYKLFILIVVVIVTIPFIFVVGFITICLLMERSNNQNYFRNKKVTSTTRTRPVNRNSWFPMG